MADVTTHEESDEHGGPAGDGGLRSHERAQWRLNFLVEASELLASSLDYQTTLASVARLAVPKLGDWCAIDMLAEDGSIQRLAVAHIDPEKVEWARELHRRYPHDPDGLHGVPNVIRTGEPEFLPYIPEELLRVAAKTDEDLELILGIGFTSAMTLPLVARGRTLGAISLVNTESGWHYTEEDLRFGMDLARRAAVAVDNAMLYREAHMQRERLEVTLNSIGDAVISTNVAGRVTFMNPVAVQLTGWEHDDAMGRPLEEIFVIVNETTGQTVESPVTKVLREGHIVGLANHTVLIGNHGRTTPIDDSAAPIRDTSGKLMGVVMVFHDVTERRRSEDALRESEARFRTMADSAPVFIWLTDHNAHCTYLNRTWLEFTGQTMEEGMGDGWMEPIHPDDAERSHQEFLASFQARENIRLEYRLRHAGGEYRWILDTGVPRYTADGTFAGYIGSCIDITERRRAEEGLRRSESQLRLVINAAPTLISYVDSDQRYRFNNLAYQQWFGFSMTELTGRHVREAFGEETYGRVRGNIETALTGERIDSEMIYPSANGGDSRHIRTSYVPDIGEDGHVRGFVVVGYDVSAQKRAEQELKEAKDAAEEANRAKDQFLAVLSHELRTPLTPVLTMVDALEGDPALPEDLQPYMEMIRRNVELEARLIDDLLDITRIARGKMDLAIGKVDAHALLRDVAEIYRNEFTRKGVELRLELEAPRHHVMADDARLRQVFGNLVQNAVKFTPEGGRVTVHTETRAPGVLVAKVSDTGIGIEPELLARIFNAFEQGEQTITRRFGGLGLGLTVSKSLIDMHDGTLTAESGGPGQGATFTVELMATSDTGDAASPEPQERTEPEAPPRLRVLLVDDHEDTSTVLKMLLERQGYQVLTGASVGEALAVAAASSFDILISDIGLPDGSGLDIIRALRERAPVKGIALSGFGMEQDVQRSLDAGFREHLTKPVSFQRLQEAITRLLDS